MLFIFVETGNRTTRSTTQVDDGLSN